MSDDELIQAIKAPPQPVEPKIQRLTPAALPKPTPRIYNIGDELDNNWTYFFIVVFWLLSLVAAFFVGGILL